MLVSELSLVLLAYAQPPLLGVILILSLFYRLIDVTWFTRLLATRRRLKSTRFFECAAYARLVGWLRYGTQGLALCVLFLLYDVDLLFFFAEATHFAQWGPSQAGLFGCYLGFFGIGLAYDFWRYGFMWS